MIRVYLDSNSLFGDPLLQKETLGKRLLTYVAERRCELHLSPVVIGELSRQVLRGLQDHHAELKARIKSLGGTYGDTANLLKLLDNFAAAGRSLIADRFETLAAGDGVFIQSFPTYNGADIVKRELELRRPFMKMEPGTVGHRDTVIWLGLLELAASFPDDTIIFVTKDKGFKQKDKLHPDLLEDLDAQSIAPERIRLFPACYPMLEFLKEVVPSAQSGTALEGEAETIDMASWRAAVTQALLEYNQALEEIKWSITPDPQDGGYRQPDYDIGLPAEFDEATIIDIDGPSNLSIDAEHPVLDQLVTCTYRVDISFDGYMRKSDWYAGEYADFDLWDADWNEEYVLVGTYRTLQLTATVRYDSVLSQATVLTLDSVTAL